MKCPKRTNEFKQSTNTYMKQTVFITTFLSLLLICAIAQPSTNLISPLAETVDVKVAGLVYPSLTPTPTAIPSPTIPGPSPTPGTAEVIQYIAQVFKDEPAHIQVKAIECFYSESGLRWNAINDKNTNGTTDAGVAQINDVHKMSVQERLDFKKNIEKAYKIYLGKNGGRKNFAAWYGARCK